MGETRQMNEKVFRPSSIVIITGGIALPIIMIFLFLNNVQKLYESWSIGAVMEALRWDIILGLLLPIAVIPACISVFGCRLIISSLGLEYHGSGRVYFTEWKNIKEIKLKSFWASYSWSSIQLYKPVPRLKGWGFSWTASVNEIQLMSGFEAQLRDRQSVLVKEIHHYLPKLKIN